MRKYTLGALFLCTIALSGCLNNDDSDCTVEPNLNVNQTQLAADIEIIDAYLEENQIEAQIDESGLRYVILNEGDGDIITLCDNVSVTYEGRLLTRGTVFDSTDEPVSFALRNLIRGWQIGIPLVRSGGEIVLYIPSVYGYGSSGAGQVIPPNANLIFTITVQ